MGFIMDFCQTQSYLMQSCDKVFELGAFKYSFCADLKDDIFIFGVMRYFPELVLANVGIGGRLLDCQAQLMPNGNLGR